VAGVFTVELRDRLVAALKKLDLGQESDRELLSSSRSFVNGTLNANVFGSYVRVELDRRQPQSPPPILVSPFTAAEARASQQAWAAYLGKQVNLSISLNERLKMQLVLIPPGEFFMGIFSKHEDSLNGTTPQHRVRITNPFYLGVYEVTQVEWESVMGKQPSQYHVDGEKKEAVANLNTSRFPVDNISWEDAVEFCRKLSDRDRLIGRSYRIPTEAEWEYSCRAGTTTYYHLGEKLDGYMANINGVDGFRPEQRHLNRPTDVGSYSANAFGLYDMHGNAHEWCEDWFSVDFYKISPVNDPINKKPGIYRVLRGGCWSWVFASSCGSGSRFSWKPTKKMDTAGFRIVCIMR
jgi:formylglycine-generating enzyme required for sulfatase activity